MENIAMWKTKQVLNCLDLKGIKRALDLGGGPGTYARLLARKGIQVTLFDRPETLPIAKELAEREGLAERITLQGGDFMEDPIGNGYDLVLLGQILHSYGPKDCLRLLKKVKKSLVSGGLVAIHEFFVKKDRSGPSSGTLFGVNMLVNTPEGRVYPVEEIKEMLKKAGFKRPVSHHLQDTVLVIART
jgi:cyclopropane fatty-acyl-phospholipid synthase-like methyltransferase